MIAFFIYVVLCAFYKKINSFKIFLRLSTQYKIEAFLEYSNRLKKGIKNNRWKREVFHLLKESFLSKKEAKKRNTGMLRLNEDNNSNYWNDFKLKKH